MRSQPGTIRLCCPGLFQSLLSLSPRPSGKSAKSGGTDGLVIGGTGLNFWPPTYQMRDLVQLYRNFSEPQLSSLKTLPLGLARISHVFEAYPGSILPPGFEFYLLNFLVCPHL